jgi:DNA-3-methyladenine glycosylase II
LTGKARRDRPPAVDVRAPRAFEIQPVAPFRLDLTAWTLRRRAHNIVDRWDGTTYRRVLPLPAGPVEVAVTQPGSADAALRVEVAGQRVHATVQSAVATALERLLGIHVSMSEFDQLAAHDRRLKPLAERFRGMKPPRFASVFECAVNAIACQQVSLTSGIHVLNRLAMSYGPSLGGPNKCAYAFPRPEDLAVLTPAQLRPLGFSQQKGRAITELAQSIASGDLDLESFASLSDDEAVSRLCELRGLGRWSAEYVLLRGLGRTHVFPGDDVGARNNLQRWLKRTDSLDYQGVRRVLSRWKRFGGLIYFHLLLDTLAKAGELGTTDA